MVKQGLGTIVKRQSLRATNDSKLWSAMISNVVKKHDTDKKNILFENVNAQVNIFNTLIMKM